MARIYLALEVDFDNDDKVSLLARYTRPGEARAARDLLVAMWRYCKAEKTDGHVPFEIVGKLCYPDSVKLGLRDAGRLVEVGLAERTETGYYFGTFLKRNRSRADIEAIAAKKAEAGRLGGKASGLVRKSEAETKQPASPPRSHLDTPTHLTPDTTTKPRSLGGERPEPLRQVGATNPPTCTAHPNGNATGPCTPCRKVREWNDRADERFKREEAERAANCVDCHGTNWVEDSTGKPIRKCGQHRWSA